MTKLQFFEAGLALIGARLGLVSPATLGKYDIYKTYLEFLETSKQKTPCKKQANARKDTAAKFRCDYATVAKAIYFFERDGYKESLTMQDRSRILFEIRQTIEQPKALLLK